MIQAGRYHFVLLERSLVALDVKPSIELRLAALADLATLDAVGIRPHHRAWLAQGSLCVWTPASDGSPAAAFWLHRFAHVDRYLGAWSKPTGQVAYGSTLMTRQDLRGHGHGGKLLNEAALVLKDCGASALRAAVAPDNVGSLRIHSRASYERVGDLVGVRIGRLRLTRTRHA